MAARLRQMNPASIGGRRRWHRAATPSCNRNFAARTGMVIRTQLPALDSLAARCRLTFPTAFASWRVNTLSIPNAFASSVEATAATRPWPVRRLIVASIAVRYRLQEFRIRAHSYAGLSIANPKRTAYPFDFGQDSWASRTEMTQSCWKFHP